MKCATPVALLLVLSFASFVNGAEAEKAETDERGRFITEAMTKYRQETYSRMRRSGEMRAIMELQPFADWDFYFVKGTPITWTPSPGEKQSKVVVPIGFVTDLASIPRLFWQTLRPEGRYAFAAVIHDYLYWIQDRSRKEADDVFKIAMKDSKVDERTIDTLYAAVRGFGQSAWDENAKRKKQGERRVLRELPDHFSISWKEWRQRPNVFQPD